MRRFRIHPQHLLRRRWKSIHPFRPRVSKRRRFAWVTALIVLSIIIAGYAYVADPRRLRDISEAYLSSALDANVKIEQARLSIFQGLTLENVRVFTANQAQPDALIFSARTLRLNYTLSSLLRGQVRATQIIATQPFIRLVQDEDTQTWNYQRLMRSSRKRPTSRRSTAAPPELPEIILRDGEIENAQVRDGHYAPLGTVWFEGRLGPQPDGRYTFTIESRPGDANAPGPQLMGWIDPAEGRAQVALRDLRFGPEMRAMLPEKVRIWCEEHQLSGALTIDNLVIGPRAGGGPPMFDVRMRLDGMNIDLSADEWRSRRESVAVAAIKQNLSTLADLGASTSADSLVGTLTRFTHAPPLPLHITTGRLHFSDNGGIQIERLIGQVGGSAFAIDGTIADYTPASAFDLRLFTPAGQPLNFPANPKYIRSLPVALQEVYDQFKPVGSCAFDVRLQRAGGADDVGIAGEVNILNGAFVFDHFPYPLRNVHGKIVIDKDPSTQQERADIVDIAGQGMAGTVNANSVVRIQGVAGPFNRRCEAHLRISGTNIGSDASVIAAMPRETQKALKLFDAPGRGEYPQFHGNFLCIVTRAPATHFHWDVDTRLDVDRAAGRLVAFPYPVENLAVQLDVHDDHLDITNAHMTKGSAKLRVDGRVSWNSHKEDGGDLSMRPVLSVRAINVPINEDLLAALPHDRADWIRTTGLGGLVDLSGKVFPNSKGDIGFNFGIHLHDGQLLRTADGSHAIHALTADGQLTDTTITAPHITARRGDATFAGALAISWAAKPPVVHFSGSATNLLLDDQLRQLLPAEAKAIWDQLQPVGTLDADATYISPDSLKMTLRPRKLAITPTAMPWRMDQLAGAVTYDNGNVQLDDVSARHDNAILALSGGGEPDDWRVHLRGKGIVIGPDFLRVAPKPLVALVKSLDLSGKFDFDFSHLIIRNDDFDFAVKLDMHSAAMNTGMPITGINGSCNLSGHFQNGAMSDLLGDFNLDSLNVLGRSASDMSFKLKKAANQDALTLYDLDGTVADGSLAGQMSFNVAPGVEDHYTLNLVLRDADITQLDPDPKSGIQGRLSASIDLEGLWSDPNTRIGRGDVLVTGQHLYKIPILLGVSQIANLSLPLNQPFTQGTAQYAVQGNNVIFDSIDLKASSMDMTGSGQMNFGTKKFDLVFTTNNPNWPKVPLINDLIVAAQHELLQIRVSGTIQEPKVSAGLLSAVPTTIERVIGK